MSRFLLLALLTIPTLLLAQDDVDNTFIVPRGPALNAVAMRNATTGIAVGDEAILRRTVGVSTEIGDTILLWSSERTTREFTNYADVTMLENDGYVILGQDMDGFILIVSQTDAGKGTVARVPATMTLNAIASHGSSIVAVGMEESSGGAIYRSTDRGATWVSTPVGVQGQLIDVCVDGTGRYTAITSDSLVQFTADGTVSARRASLLDQTRIATAKRPITGEWMLFRIAVGLHFDVSLDGGVSWTNLLESVHDNNLVHMDALPLSMAVNPDLLMSSVMFFDESTNTPLHFVSFDGGMTWTEQCQNFTSNVVGGDQVVVSPTRLVCVADPTITLTFGLKGAGTQQFWYAPEGFMSPAGVMAGAIRSGSAIVGTSMGNWDLTERRVDHEYATPLTHNDHPSALKQLLVSGDTILVAADSTWADVVDDKFVGRSRAHVMRSTTNGRTWTRTWENDSVYGHQSMTRARDGAIILFPYGRSTVWSTDGGATFTTRSWSDTSLYSMGVGCGLGMQEAICFATRPSTGEFVMMRTTNAGVSWNETPTTRQPVAITMLSNGRLLLAERKELFVSDDQGASWRSVYIDQNPSEWSFFRTLESNDKGRVLATGTGHIVVSADHANTWRSAMAVAVESWFFVTSMWSGEDTLVALSNNGLIYVTAVTDPVGVFDPAASSTTQAHAVYMADGFVHLPADVQTVQVATVNGQHVNVPVSFTGTSTTANVQGLASGAYVLSYVRGSERKSILFLR